MVAHPIRHAPQREDKAPSLSPVRSFDGEEGEEEMEKETSRVVYGVFSILIIFGVLTGFFLTRITPGAGNAQSVASGAPVVAKSGKLAAGVEDKATFKDSAKGTVEQGGLDGEGTHKLVREGGPSQTVHLISSVADLDTFVGKTVTVWGQTMAAKKAAWLMDVGRIEEE